MKLLKKYQRHRKSVEDRLAEGKELRNKYPRKDHDIYKEHKSRPDPVKILKRQAKTRLPYLVPVRYARMLTSPFAFLRGSAAIMASDLHQNDYRTGISVQACGDMHVANFGVFATPERNLVFGINDFDETIPGPWEWDLKRLAASIVASGRHIGGTEDQCRDGVMAAVESYRKRMKQYANYGNLELWYERISDDDVLKAVGPAVSKRAQKIFAKARQRTHMQVLEKLTDIVDENFRLRDDAPFITHETHTQSGRPINEGIELFLRSYIPTLIDDRRALLENYRLVDVVRKVVGVGSVGTRCWVILMQGNHWNDPLFLQVKEAQPSVLEPYVNKSEYSNQGRRVVSGQRIIQGAPDIFLGWGEVDGLHFYVRQLRDMKGGVDFTPGKADPANISVYASLCAWALALAHARSGDAALLSGYLGNSEELDEAITRFAFAYADQTEKDHKALEQAAKLGKIKVAGE